MNEADYRAIEHQLGVVLPKPFREFMAAMPDSMSDRVCIGESVATACNAELFGIDQLRMRTEAFDCYELQPELRPRRFIRIGDDGVGNYYYMPGDDAVSDELWFWSHDPYDGFILQTDVTLSSFLGSPSDALLVEQADPLANPPGAFITRADHPLRSIIDPIAIDDWIDFVEQSEDLTLDENHYAKNPFTGEEVVLRRWPGRASLAIANESHMLSYLYGAISLGDCQSSGMKARAAEIATELNAAIWQST